ncbi:hypothetical protein F4811DRAFT_549404 [Daldinia bambusicola]|nr:hypothetical protein F4811DRAFT_549404 [Daldinia bambusicola]
MAPATMVFDYRGQIIDNCEFFLAKHDVVSVVTVKHVLGDFKAYAIRSNQSSREALLSSASRSTPLLAIESLHAKSCEAVQHFINTNGFSYPPDLKKTRFDDDDDDDNDDDDDDNDEDEDEEDGNDDDDIASIFSNLLSDRPALPTAAMSYKSSSDGEVKMTPISSTVPITHGREVGDERSNNIGKHRTNLPPPPPPPGRQSPEASNFPNFKPLHMLPPAEEIVREFMNGPLSMYFSRGSGPPPPPPPPPPTYSSTTPAPRPQPASIPVPGPIPGPSWPPASCGVSAPPVNYPSAHPRSIPPPPPRQQANSNNNSNNFPPMMAPPPPPPPQPRGPPVTAAAVAAANTRLYDIALTIRWLGHGEARVLASCRASVQALKSTAVTYVTRYASAFDRGRDGSGSSSKSPLNSNKNNHSHNCNGNSKSSGKWHGTVRLRRASIRNLHDEEYDLNMELYQEDDLTRFCGGRGIPRFEVEVEDRNDGEGEGEEVGVGVGAI